MRHRPARFHRMPPGMSGRPHACHCRASRTGALPCLRLKRFKRGASAGRWHRVRQESACRRTVATTPIPGQHCNVADEHKRTAPCPLRRGISRGKQRTCCRSNPAPAGGIRPDVTAAVLPEETFYVSAPRALPPDAWREGGRRRGEPRQRVSQATADAGASELVACTQQCHRRGRPGDKPRRLRRISRRDVCCRKTADNSGAGECARVHLAAARKIVGRD